VEPSALKREFRVVFVSRPKARWLVDLGPTASFWRDPAGAASALRRMRAGDLVRVRPPAGETAEQVEHVRTRLLAEGAAAVKVLPGAPGPSVVSRASRATPVRGIREVVMAVAARARTNDRALLDAVLEAALAAEGV